MTRSSPVCVRVYAVVDQTAEGGEEVHEGGFGGLAAGTWHYLKLLADVIQKCVVDGLGRESFERDADDHGEFGGVEGDEVGDGCWGEIVIGALAAGAGAGGGVGRVVDGFKVSEDVDDELELGAGERVDMDGVGETACEVGWGNG